MTGKITWQEYTNGHDMLINNFPVMHISLFHNSSS